MKFPKNHQKKILKTKNRKNRMYAYHKYLSSTGSEGFKQIHSTTSSTTGAHFYQKYFCHLFLADSRWTRAWDSGSKMVSQTMDFDGFPWTGSTSRSSNSMMPRSLRMFGHVFNVYSSRSRDLEGSYTERKSSRDRKFGQQLDDFAFLAFQRYVRPIKGLVSRASKG